MSDQVRVGLSWPSLVAFVRLVSNPFVVRRPVAPRDARARVTQWFARDQVWIPQPGSQHADILGKLLAVPAVTSRLVADAHLAALAFEHGLRLCSTDGDFAKSPDLTCENPPAGNT